MEPGYLTDEQGHRSNMRLLSLLSLLAAILLALNDAGMAWMDKDGVGIAYIIPFLGGAFGGKFAQKFLEAK